MVFPKAKRGEISMSIHEQERDAKLLPVAGVIFACYVVIMVSSYFIGNYLF